MSTTIELQSNPLNITSLYVTEFFIPGQLPLNITREHSGYYHPTQCHKLVNVTTYDPSWL